MEIEFWKLQGNGNDFILIDEHEHPVIPDEMKAEFAALYCDRRFGIGGDGVLYLSVSETADLKMRLFQPDRSEAEMCGNGIRCFARHAYEMGYIGTTCTVETPAGIMTVGIDFSGDTFIAAVDIPEPRFLRKDIPATGDGEAGYREKIGDFEVYAVNTGVPHAVVFSSGIDSLDIDALAPAIRNHPSFPKGANVDFVEVAGDNTISVRTFERGVEGETLSCGTGSVAAAAVAAKLGLAKSPVTVQTRGGDLEITLGARTILRGPAETVFWGRIVF